MLRGEQRPTRKNWSWLTTQGNPIMSTNPVRKTTHILHHPSHCRKYKLLAHGENYEHLYIYIYILKNMNADNQGRITYIS